MPSKKRSPWPKASLMSAVLFTQELMDAITAYQNGIYLVLRPFVGLTRDLLYLRDLLRSPTTMDNWLDINSVTFAFEPLHDVLEPWYEVHGTACVFKLFACLPRLRNVVIAHAAFSGNLAMLSMLPLDMFRQVRYLLLDLAAANGHMRVLKFLDAVVGHEGCTTFAMDVAAHRGDLDVVRYLHAHRNEGCSDQAIMDAAENGHLEVVQFLHTHYPLTAHSLTLALTAAAATNRLDVATYIVHELGSDGHGSTNEIDAAAYNGHLAMIKMLHQHNYGCTTNAMDDAAEDGQLEVVQWLHTHRTEGCTINAMGQAAENGHLETVQWLHTHRGEGCPDWTLQRAAYAEQWDVVKFLVTWQLGGDAKTVMEMAKQDSRDDIAVGLAVILDETSILLLNGC
ncbi:hypothetical protein DYB31_009877 [Aphanomyces astaci]|uniref:Uncharacterized protein n=1 Tax=Aphanomyces astaci TaxID=112090 RepID=A0A397FS41_APHAT|nr:hypothetical protein DYB31_009877 [Aphanomyces astaci]